MDTNLELLLQENIFKYFYEISQIPRESGNEKTVSDYIYNLTKNKGLECYQDNLSNLIIKKNGQGKSAGSKPLILQAHLDMVCVKNEKSTHNFETDPISWKIIDDWIYSDKGTSLGADCGIGVAIVLAVLMSEDISHPPIEAVLTTREETDMLGAYEIDSTYLAAKRMINFDISPDNRLLAGSCGGTAIEVNLPLNFDTYNNHHKTFSIKLNGMKGGHSGANINSGHGNAIVLLARMLKYLTSKVSYDLISFEGGNSRLAIPTFAKCIISISADMENEFKNSINCFSNKLHNELYSYSPQAEFSLEENHNVPTRVIQKSYVDKIITACLLLPTGIQEMNFEPKNTVESSCNLGFVKMNDNSILFISETRSMHTSTMDFTVEKSKLISDILGATVSTYSEYSSWKYSNKSQLRDTITHEYKKLFGDDMDIFVAHSGNEIGIFYNKIKGLDAVAMGPTREKYHTPNEMLSISSVRKHYHLLLNSLSNL